MGKTLSVLMDIDPKVAVLAWSCDRKWGLKKVRHVDQCYVLGHHSYIEDVFGGGISELLFEKSNFQGIDGGRYEACTMKSTRFSYVSFSIDEIFCIADFALCLELLGRIFDSLNRRRAGFG